MQKEKNFVKHFQSSPCLVFLWKYSLKQSVDIDWYLRSKKSDLELDSVRHLLRFAEDVFKRNIMILMIISVSI